MRKIFILFICIMLIIPFTVIAKDFYIIITKAKYDSISTANKIKVRDELAKCTSAPIPIKLSWSWRVKGSTNEGNKVGIALYSGNAWVLNMKENLDSNKIAKIKGWFDSNSHAKIGYTTNFFEMMDGLGLEEIPSSLE